MSQAATEGQEPTGAAGATGQEPEAQGGTGQEPAAQTGNTDGQQNQDGQVDVESITDPALKAFVIKQQKEAAEARSEAAKHRTEKAALQAKVTEHERAGETADQAAAREAQEAKDERDRLAEENRALKVGQAIRTAAEGAKALDTEMVLELIGPKVELDENGSPTNVAALLADLRTKSPFLFKRTSANAGEGNGEEGQPTGDMNAAIRRAAGRS